jgi:hypothetical protein
MRIVLRWRFFGVSDSYSFGAERDQEKIYVDNYVALVHMKTSLQLSSQIAKSLDLEDSILAVTHCRSLGLRFGEVTAAGRYRLEKLNTRKSISAIVRFLQTATVCTFLFL